MTGWWRVGVGVGVGTPGRDDPIKANILTGTQASTSYLRVGACMPVVIKSMAACPM